LHSTRNQEAEANAFAMALLMPEIMVKDALKKLYRRNPAIMDDEIIRTLAHKFEVQEYLMTLRLHQLGAFKDITADVL